MFALLTQSVFAVAGMGLLPVSKEGEATRGIFTYSVDPGDHISDTVKIINTGDTAQTVALTSVDATMTDTGDFALKDLSETMVGIGTWVKLDKNKITVGPSSTAEVNFTIDVPSSLAPGDYAGGLLISPDMDAMAESSSESSGAVSIIRVGVRIYVSVSGEKVFKFVAGTDEQEPYTHSVEVDGTHNFNFAYKNEGNTNMDVSADLELKNLFFKLDSVHADFGTLMPGVSGTPKINWTKAPKIGFITATSTLNYVPVSVVGSVSDEDLKKYSGSETNSVSFFIIPIKEMSAGLAVFVVSFLFFFWRHRKFMKMVESCKASVAKKDESLLTFAGRNKVDWKLLAKINRIGSPYMISKGAKILVPHAPALPKK